MARLHASMLRDLNVDGCGCWIDVGGQCSCGCDGCWIDVVYEAYCVMDFR